MAAVAMRRGEGEMQRIVKVTGSYDCLMEWAGLEYVEVRLGGRRSGDEACGVVFSLRFLA